MPDKKLHYIDGVGWRYDKESTNTRRMYNHDYKARCIYMITITLADRSKPLLGTLRWKAPGEATVDLTPLGERVSECWTLISKFHSEVRSIVLQIMPEHLHGVLFITQDQEDHLGEIVKGFKIGCSKAWWKLEPSLLFESQGAAGAGTGVDALCAPSYNSANGTQGTANGTQGTIGGTQGEPLAAPAPSASSSRILPHSKGAKGPALFDFGYNDLVLLHEGQLGNMINYVMQNPMRALVKRDNPDLFRVVRDLQFGGHTFAAIGNHWLLERPMRMQVRCHNNTSETNLQLIARQKEYFLQRGQRGGVVVSPCISPGEREIARAALDAQQPLIVILENGFAPLYKPPGKYFEACAKGLLLMLAPWPHHNERRTITREQCLALNDMAYEICDEPWTDEMENLLIQDIIGNKT